MSVCDNELIKFVPPKTDKEGKKEREMDIVDNVYIYMIAVYENQGIGYISVIVCCSFVLLLLFV